MRDITSIFRERLSSPDLAERVQARWGIVHYTVENTRAKLVAEHSQEALLSDGVAHLPPETARPAPDATHIGSGVFHAEAYRYRHEQLTAQTEEIGQERMAQHARLMRDAAFDENYEHDRHHEYGLPS